jgi:hypothetical protein
VRMRKTLCDPSRWACGLFSRKGAKAQRVYRRAVPARRPIWDLTASQQARGAMATARSGHAGTAIPCPRKAVGMAPFRREKRCLAPTGTVGLSIFAPLRLCVRHAWRNRHQVRRAVRTRATTATPLGEVLPTAASEERSGGEGNQDGEEILHAEGVGCQVSGVRQTGGFRLGR